MQPVKILAENFKGRDFDYPLKKVNLFTGPNESGKTAAIRASLVALLGYDPSIGKQPSATYGYASELRSTPLTVHMEFNDGSFITRTFKRNTKGEVSRDVKGAIPEIPEVLFNASDYLKATEQERIKMAFEKIDVSKIAIKDDDLFSRLARIEVTPIAVCNSVLQDLAVFAMQTMKRRDNLKQTTQAWLEELVKGLQEKAKGEAGLLKGAQGEMTSLRPAGKTPESQAPKIAAVKERLSKLSKEMAELESQQSTYNKSASRREWLQQELAKPAVDTSAQEKELSAIEEKIVAFRSSSNELRTNCNSFEKEITAKQLERGEITGLIKQIDARILELEGKVKCPYCKSSRQGWKEENKIELGSERVMAVEKLTAIDERLTWLHDQRAGLKADLALAEKADKQFNDWQTTRLNLSTAIKKATASAPDRSAIEGELKGLNSIDKPSDAAIKKVADDLAAARKEDQELQAAESAFITFQSNSTKFREVESKVIKHQVANEVYKRAAQLVIAEQQAIVTAAFDSILAPARRFTDGIVGGQLTYQNGTLGIITNQGFVEHKFMAESRKQLVYLGLQVALAQQSPIKAIFLDELGIFDASSKLQVINRFLELTKEGFIHICLCADPDKSTYAAIQDPEFQVVELK